MQNAKVSFFLLGNLQARLQTVFSAGALPRFLNDGRIHHYAQPRQGEDSRLILE